MIWFLWAEEGTNGGVGWGLACMASVMSERHVDVQSLSVAKGKQRIFMLSENTWHFFELVLKNDFWPAVCNTATAVSLDGESTLALPAPAIVGPGPRRKLGRVSIQTFESTSV